MSANSTAISAAAKKSSRLFLTPERFVWIILLLEIFLWLSDRYRWFSFNEKKGLTVLLAIAILGFSLLLFFLWFLSAWFFRRPFQFGIRTLMILTIAVAVPFSWLAVSIERAIRNEKYASVLKDRFECHVFVRESLGVSEWAKNLLGKYFFQQTYWICMPNAEFSDEDFKRCCEIDELEECVLSRTAITDAGLVQIDQLTRLKRLVLRDTPLTDAGLKYLERLPQLEMLDLTNTNITESGVQALQAKLPHCKILW